MASRIILVLDESGSMGKQRKEVVEGVNSMITQQKSENPAENSSIFFTLVTFSDVIREVCDTTLEKCELIQESDYKPSGSTALFDAIGRTIRKYQKENNVIMIVATDGKENASSEFTKYSQIVEMVKKSKQERNWSYIYISEDIDTFEQGNQMGMSNTSTSKNVKLTTSEIGNYMKSDGYSSAVSGYRKYYTSMN